MHSWNDLQITQLQAGVAGLSLARKPWGLYVMVGLIGVVVLLFIILHLTGRGLHAH